jgi:hypothetical protein
MERMGRSEVTCSLLWLDGLVGDVRWRTMMMF